MSISSASKSSSSCDLRRRGGSARPAEIPSQCLSICLRGSQGRMARITWRKAKPNSRQRLACLDCLQAVSPGGKCARLGQNLVGQQRHKQLAVEPGFGALRVLLGQMAELGYLLETFED